MVTIYFFKVIFFFLRSQISWFRNPITIIDYVAAIWLLMILFLSDVMALFMFVFFLSSEA